MESQRISQSKSMSLFFLLIFICLTWVMHAMMFSYCLVVHFLKHIGQKVNMHLRTLTMEFDGDEFNIFGTMRFPADFNYVSTLDVINELCSRSFVSCLMVISHQLCSLKVQVFVFYGVLYNVYNDVADDIGFLLQLQVIDKLGMLN